MLKDLKCALFRQVEREREIKIRDRHFQLGHVLIFFLVFLFRPLRFLQSFQTILCKICFLVKSVIAVLCLLT